MRKPSAARSCQMAGIRQKNTAPELAVRKALWSLGFRYRLHRRDLPGSPDIVLGRRSTVIFVHGCFWHRHGCGRTTTPSRNRGFWAAKFVANVRRDERTVRALRAAGWRVLVVWECQTRDIYTLSEWLTKRLERGPLHPLNCPAGSSRGQRSRRHPTQSRPHR